jgi:hypothetical protein
MGQVGAVSIANTSGAGALSMQRVYLQRTADGRLTFSSHPPSDAELIEDAEGRWIATPDVFGQLLMKTPDNRLLVYLGDTARVYLRRTTSGRLAFSLSAPAAAELALNEDDLWEPVEVSTGQRLYTDRDHRLTTTG